MGAQKKKRHNKVTFKPYDQNQMWLLPPSLGDLIPANHLVRLVNVAIEGLDLEPILNTYEGGGSSAYHPRMLLKALVYGYIEKLYSSRKIEKALKENICFMWLCGMQQPDHNTLNRFRKGQLKNTVKDVFAQVLLLLIDQGHVNLEEYHVDGTKMESVANRYTFVWAKNVARYKASVLEKVAALVDQIEQSNEEAEAAAQEQTKPGTSPIADSEALAQTIDRLNEQLATELGKNKQLKKKLDKLEKEHLPKLRQYEEQERKLDGRSSYSKTDPDATFMRMKDDHMKNGQLKPGYNVQIGTEDQFIVNYTIHQSTVDAPVFVEHMDNTKSLLAGIDQSMPQRIGGDAGYGYEQNYDYLEAEGLGNYLKYPGFFQEQQKKYQQNPFLVANLYYNPEQDCYICPMGQRLSYWYTGKEQKKSGYQATYRVYRARRCDGCPLRGQCYKAKQNRRIIRMNQNLNRHRQQARDNLWSLRGIRMRKKRGVDVEPVFGHIKACRSFRRFMLRSLAKVNIEFGLLAIAHNIKKWWAKLQRGPIIRNLDPKNGPIGPNPGLMLAFSPNPSR
ncbi:MAG: IS1182 family transposase [Saprospiraceae bacterium]